MQNAIIKIVCSIKLHFALSHVPGALAFEKSSSSTGDGDSAVSIKHTKHNFIERS